jgi:NDP-sugar pyrophosphorylase family protein
MAGGIGSRLKPMTLAIPKPLIPVGDKPILETLLRWLSKQGFRDIILCVGYKSELIEAYFGDGSRFGVRISYFKEKKRLGTAGALRPVRDIFRINEPILMMNGDIITKLDFRKMVDFHFKNNSNITIGTKEKEMQTKYGVLDIKENRLVGVREKPSFKFNISAGIYIINPDMLNYIRPNSYFDMPALINTCLKNKRKVLCYDIKEYWKAIDRFEDFNEANSKGNSKLLNWISRIK